jgi:hypothetical protein
MPKMTDAERAVHTTEVVTASLAAMRAEDWPEANQLLTHAVHDGCTPSELVAEAIAQTGGSL